MFNPLLDSTGANEQERGMGELGKGGGKGPGSESSEGSSSPISRDYFFLRLTIYAAGGRSVQTGVMAVSF